MSNNSDYINQLSIEKVRDHLSNERTFLAWIRTSIALMVFGFVLEKFSLFLKQMKFFFEKTHSLNSADQNVTANPGYSAYLGLSLVLVGTFVIILALIKYKKIEKQINTESYRLTIFIDLLLAFLILSIAIFLTIYLISQIF